MRASRSAPRSTTAASTVVSMYEVGTSFGLDGGVITSDLNFLRLLPTRQKSAIDFGLIKLEPGQDAKASAGTN